MERRSHRSAPSVRRARPRGQESGARKRPARTRRERAVPPWLTLLGSIVFLLICFAFIFFVAKSCVATQESSQIRKYVTGADSALSDSANVGNEQLQGAISAGLEDPASLDAATIKGVADESQKYYLGSLRNEEVPLEFEDAHHYMVTALGIRAAATGNLAAVAQGDSGEFEEAVSSAVEDYKLSDAIVRDHYVPSSEESLKESGQRGDQNYLYEPRPFMDYEALGLGSGSTQEAAMPEDPNALRDVRIVDVKLAGQPLLPGGNVVLTGSDELTFSVTIANAGEVAETGVQVEVVLNTRAERQAILATVERMDPGGTAIVEVRGFKPGEFNETAPVSIEAGPVEYEQRKEDNTLAGTVTFGI
ncbi:MAG: ATPase involved in DNA repair [uncultured Rubrobacteraceae bacterium]|uniref:ATPase involved in DNA repair n=1 Tax=uncultured Rubrobacteraceae bacterium TaxID=349277 RepID=A0A6J4R254_9ACTN|nr:MAG: ATPase involved in DNA repair [uncultured Rubrobacteraceae bacterium]